MDILVTGFNKFGDLEFNPSQILVEELGRRKYSFNQLNLITEVLPTEFEESEKKIESLINDIKPRIILLTGASQSKETIYFERFALNIDDSELPDNIGMKPSGVKIRKDGNEAYLTNLPLNNLINDLNKLGIKAKTSNHAGTFVCNHVYYIANYLISKKQYDISLGFIHIPLLSINRTNNIDSELNIVKLVSVFEKMIMFLYQYYK